MNFFLLSLLKAGVVAGVLLTTLAYLQWVERKVIAHIQLRMGPSRVGPHGLLQPLADVVKLLTKEDLLPAHVNKFLYLLAPFLAVSLALTAIAVIPFGPEIEVFGIRTQMGLTDLNIGVLFLLALSSVGVYAIALAGWASNNKYALLGALRSSAQMISYELPLALAVVAPLLLANTLSLREIADGQAGSILDWSILKMPAPQLLSFLIFAVAGFAETNRIPFDLPEAENELVAGFHTEYSSMKFACFFMAEYLNMATASALTVTLFFGGATLPGVTLTGWLGLFVSTAVFVAKMCFFLWLFVWVRWSLPRFRYDQLMQLGWKGLLPLATLNLVWVGIAMTMGWLR